MSGDIFGCHHEASGGEMCYRHLVGRGQGSANCTGQHTTKSSLAPSGNNGQAGKSSNISVLPSMLNFSDGNIL